MFLLYQDLMWPKNWQFLYLLQVTYCHEPYFSRNTDNQHITVFPSFSLKIKEPIIDALPALQKHQIYRPSKEAG